MKTTTQRKLLLVLILGLTLDVFAFNVLKNETIQKIENFNQIENNLKDSSNLANTLEINKYNLKKIQN